MTTFPRRKPRQLAMSLEGNDYGEPWSMPEEGHLPHAIRTRDGSQLSNRGRSVEDKRRLSKRAVVCVNACKGIPSENLKRFELTGMLTAARHAVKTGDVSMLEGLVRELDWQAQTHAD